ncbi:universal stress protein [Arthrobacter burdickii]|uniref:Universal stress protein n=1 Tax=Arthrobacter burdickii TaxID=3035920 RepID=A0ABT8JYZ2_9MICC|nr:universal stress protein [Arthrobacter burdickii]MDN4610398.1 universal stress protein [Arthrobacter burdickii]
MKASQDSRATTPRPDKRVRPLVVAVRDAATGGPAVLWAARRAKSLGVPLTLVHAVPDPALMPPGSPYGDVVIRGREVLRTEASRISADFPALHVGTYLHCGDVVEALLGLAAESPLLILGSDRMDAASGEFRGSVSLQVALGSRVPVVVVPSDDGRSPGTEGTIEGTADATTDATSGGVVVGVDGSPLSGVALLRAADEAHAMGTTLTVVSAPVHGSGVPQTPVMQEGASALLLHVSTRYPHLAVRQVLDEVRDAAQALAHYGAGADLLVIGRHGRGARTGMYLGSVTHTLLLHPPCPTLVVPDPGPVPPLDGKLQEPERTPAR